MITLEICVDRIDSLQAAIAGGAHRIELCGALDLGGLTPSYGLIASAVTLAQTAPQPVAVMVMIRPHAGRFTYSIAEVHAMQRDIDAAKQLGADGIVLGALDTRGHVDESVVRDLLAAARPLSVTFHRAFDLVPQPLAAIDQLCALGVDRVLTSGQAATALAGAPLIERLVRHVGSTIAIMAGAGVNSRNAREIIRMTGVRELHASARARAPGPDFEHNSQLDFVHPERVTDAAEVQAILAAVGT